MPEDENLTDRAAITRRSIHSDAGSSRPRPLVWPWIVGAFGLVLGATAAFTGAFLFQAGQAGADLRSAQTKISSMPQTVADGDVAGVEQVAGEISALAASAHARTEGPLWDIAVGIPGLGENIAAVRTLTQVTVDLTNRALPPAVALLKVSDFSSIAVEGGGIDLEPFRQAETALPEINAAFADAQNVTSGIDADALVPVVAEPLIEFRNAIAATTPSLDLVQQYLPTLLAAAGDGEPKTYLVIFQNNAEIRATGGNPAASVIMRVDNGHVEMAGQASSASFYAAGTAGDSYLQLPQEVLDLYPSTFTRYSQDYTFTPDFPTTAALFQSLWEASYGEQFDGVISIDPVVLSHILEVTGPVDLLTGDQITADNAVQLLLSDAYQRYGDLGDGGATSDAFFADTAARVFSRLTSGEWDPIAMFQQLERSAQEQRINLWFSDPEAQSLVTQIGLDGALKSDNTTATEVGIYLNDYSVGKLEYHLSTSVTAVCDPAASTITVEMTMTNSIPDSITNGYTLGARNGKWGLANTTMMLDTLFFAPPGGQILSIDPADGDIASLQRSGSQNGNSAESRLITVAQGETKTVRYTVQLPSDGLGPLRLRHTPTASDTAVTIDPGCNTLFGTTAAAR